MAYNRTREAILARSVSVAESVFARTRGLLGRKCLPRDEALWIVPCNAIHNFFMRFPIDALFLDRQGRVVAIYHGLRPWRATWFVRGAHSVLELAEGVLAENGARVGDQVDFVEQAGEADVRKR